MVVNILQQEDIVESFVFLVGHNTENTSDSVSKLVQSQVRAMLKKLNAIDAQLSPLTDNGTS